MTSKTKQPESTPAQMYQDLVELLAREHDHVERRHSDAMERLEELRYQVEQALNRIHEGL